MDYFVFAYILFAILGVIYIYLLCSESRDMRRLRNDLSFRIKELKDKDGKLIQYKKLIEELEKEVKKYKKIEEESDDIGEHDRKDSISYLIKLKKIESSIEKKQIILNNDIKKVLSFYKNYIIVKDKEVLKCIENIDILKNKVNKLKRYKNTLDLEEKLKKEKKLFRKRSLDIISKLRGVDSTIQQKQNSLAEHVQKSDELILQKKNAAKQAIKQQVIQAQQQREKIFKASSQEAAQVIARAEQLAQKVAGEALVAAKYETQLATAIKAMENSMLGYGEEYLVPTISALDQLAADYDGNEAGRELKNARERVRRMIRKNEAASCELPDATQRRHAVHFVLDAFNGKVDSLLSTVPYSNYGKLQQQVVDAFALVNYNGTSFGKARISPLYLDLRLDELKWAVRTHQLRVQSRKRGGQVPQEQ